MAYWRFQSKTAINAVDCPRTSVRRVAWQPGQGGLLALVTNHGGRLVNTGIMKKDSVAFGANMGKMEELAWSPAGDLLATVGERAIIWNSNGTVNQELQVTPIEMKIFMHSFDAPKFSKDGRFIVVSKNFRRPTYHRLFYKFDISTGALRQSFGPITLPNIFSSLVWKNELEVFCEGLNKTINLWRIGQKEPLQTLTFTGSVMSKMAFNPKRNILAFTKEDAPTAVCLWKIDTHLVSLLTGHDAPVIEFVWQSDQSDILATFDELGEVRIWETTSDSSLHVYNVFLNDTRHLHASFSPNGRFIAASSEREVKVVKFDTGDTVAVCERNSQDLGNSACGGAVEWSAKGDKLAVEMDVANFSVFNVDRINFGINFKRLSMLRVASLLEGNLVNGKEEARKFLTRSENKIPGRLVDDVLPYLK